MESQAAPVAIDETPGAIPDPAPAGEVVRKVRPDEVFPHARPPAWVRAACWVGDRAMNAGLLASSFDPDELRAAAEANTGLSDWGEGFESEAFHKLIESADTDARLNCVGRKSLSGLVRTALANWLCLVEERKRKPQQLQTPLQRPIVIAAMPRTGSTLLHQLLACHPDVRHLPMWLAPRPLPAPSPEVWRSGGTPERRRAMKTTLRLMNAAMPSMRHIHPYGADLPVECTHLMAATFHSNQFAAWPVYSYFDWIATQPRPSYLPYRQQLELLQASVPGEGWVLKSPGHFVGVESIYTALPEALIVHLHRDPARVFPSLNSMMATHHMLFSGQLDFQRSSDVFLRTFERAATDVLALRRRVGSERFLDVGYKELKADPVAVARRIIERVGLRWDDQVHAALSAGVADAARERRGAQRHEYPTTQYGLTPDGLRNRFAGYMAAFDIEREA